LVTITALEQYGKLKNEIIQTVKRLDELKNDENGYAFDTVKGSSTVFPYQEKIIAITGISQRHINTVKQLELKLRNRIAYLENMIIEIEKFIDTVELSEIRQIIQYHYIQGLTWKMTARKVYGYPCEDRARKAITRYFIKI